MSKRSRDKGGKAQREGRDMVKGWGWDVVGTSSGVAEEDVVAQDPSGCRWSVEITADQTVSLATKWAQTKRQAQARGALPLLVWKFDRAGWWVVVEWPKSVTFWLRQQDLPGGLDVSLPDTVQVTPPQSWHPRRVAQTLTTLRAEPMPVVVFDGLEMVRVSDG